MNSHERRIGSKSPSGVASWLIAGKGMGRVKGDRHIAAAKGTPLANAMLAVAQKFGAEIDKLGVSSGRLEI